MKKGLALLVIVVLSSSGCWLCKKVDPNLLSQARTGVAGLQVGYEVLVEKYVDNKTDTIIHATMIGTDAALGILGEQLAKNCPDTKQLQLGVTTAKGAIAGQKVIGAQ